MDASGTSSVPSTESTPPVPSIPVATPAPTEPSTAAQEHLHQHNPTPLPEIADVSTPVPTSGATPTPEAGTELIAEETLETAAVDNETPVPDST